MEVTKEWNLNYLNTGTLCCNFMQVYCKIHSLKESKALEPELGMVVSVPTPVPIFKLLVAEQGRKDVIV